MNAFNSFKKFKGKMFFRLYILYEIMVKTMLSAVIHYTMFILSTEENYEYI